jgi:cobalt-zinc-cadmium efflux system membrane fusion protein
MTTKYFIDMKNILLFTYGFLALLLSQCAPKNDGHQPMKEPEAHADEVVMLSTEQMKTIGLELGHLSMQPIGHAVKANGYLETPPQNKAFVSPKITGFVRRIRYLVGDRVQKGQVITVLESLEFLEMQQQYLDLSARLDFLKNEYERQETLSAQDGTARKTYIKAQSDYRAALASFSGLTEKLKLIGADMKALENGTLSAEIYVRAPIDGVVSAVHAVLGAQVRPGEPIMAIVNPEHLHLELRVFEKDIMKIEKGQPVLFTIPNSGPEVYEGEVFLVGQNLEEDRRYIQVHVHFEEEKGDFKVGMYARASFITGSDTAMVVPASALVADGGNTYLFVKSTEQDGQTGFQRIPVTTGMEEQGMTEITNIDETHRQSEIVTGGAFYLLNAFAEGGGHGH